MYKVELQFSNPIINAAGILGFAPERNCPVDISRLGAFVTNPISREPRRVAHGARLVTYSGGFLLHTGYPNPGLRVVIRRYAGRWSQLAVPVIVHVLASTPEDVYQMVLDLEQVDAVVALELGMPPHTDAPLLAELLQAARGERPIIIRLPYESAVHLAETIKGQDKPMLSISPPRGQLFGSNGQLVSGRLYGPAVLPLMLPKLRQLSEIGFSVIGSGGVYSVQDILAMQAVGAKIIQLDAVLWRGEIPNNI